MDISNVYTDADIMRGFVGEINSTSYTLLNSIGYTMDSSCIENIYRNEDVKQTYKTFSKFNRKGYLNFINPRKSNENTDKRNVFIYCQPNWTSCFYTESQVLNQINVAYPKVKNIVLKTRHKGKCDDIRKSYPSIVGVCSQSNNKRLAIDAYNEIYSDKNIANLLLNPYYVIGNDEKTTASNIRENYYDRDIIALHRGMINEYIIDSVVGEEWDNGPEKKNRVDSIAINENMSSKLYDLTKVSKIIKKIKKIENKYIGTGVTDGKIIKEDDFDTAWEEFLCELDNAGINEILECVNKQE